MSEKTIAPQPVRRAALYIRVSTDEQAKKGYSLPAQKDDLESYAKRNGYAIAGYYIDEGKSARKKFTARREFMRMMEDVKADKIDVILFIKLDRWFRSVADYYKIQEILDAHGVAWKTTQEHYDTETTNGRLYINIRLSVAQDESDRDSDRIKFVFDSKVSRGEVISGSLPLGLKIEGKRVVPDLDAAESVRALFRHFREHGCASGAMRYVRNSYNILLYDHTVRRMLRNPLYKGAYRDNPNYCEALIPPAEFDEIQEMLARRSIRSNQTGRIYIFSGLLICAECGLRMTARYSTSGTTEYRGYRCQNAALYHRCTHSKYMSEEKLEQWLIMRVAAQLNKWKAEWEVQALKTPKPRVDRACVARKLEKLKDLYMNDLITLEQYRLDYEKHSARLTEDIDEPQPPADFSAIRQLLSGAFPELYAGLDRSQRRDLWRSVVSAIYIDGDNTPRLQLK